jgi:hypothetical protein
MDNRSNSRANTCQDKSDLTGGRYLLDTKANRATGQLVIHNN